MFSVTNDHFICTSCSFFSWEVFPGISPSFNFTSKWFPGTLVNCHALLSHFLSLCYLFCFQQQPWASHSHTWPKTKTRVKTRWRLLASSETVKRRTMGSMETCLSSRTWSSLDGTASRARHARVLAESHEVNASFYTRLDCLARRSWPATAEVDFV